MTDALPFSSKNIRCQISPDRKANGKLAACCGAEAIRAAIAQNGKASIIVATGASQFEMLEALVREPDIAWEKVGIFHLDEYVGLPISHPASFRAYLWQRFHRLLPYPPKDFHYISGDGDPAAECARLNALIDDTDIDLCFAGIGENGHLAFNDPPADFKTVQSYLVVNLDEACRRQQAGEGWFKSLDEVPRQAISISIHRVLRSRMIVITAPDERKAVAVRNSIEGEVTPEVPASILQMHGNVHLFVDEAAASRLRRKK